MAVSDYFHCWNCGEKALYWTQWDSIGCAHCQGDAERAEVGVVRVYCTDCTRILDGKPEGAPLPKTDRWSPTEIIHDGETTERHEGELATRHKAGSGVLWMVVDGWAVEVPQHLWETLRLALVDAEFDEYRVREKGIPGR